MANDADRQTRQDALDPETSFIVEAPAGSGKTELLIQRYLLLLSRVERPEQIIAITFTRKAAAEMRERLIATLHSAAADESEIPEHRRQSRQLAIAVLAHAAKQGWSLVDQPGRLRITTIDSFSAGLAQQMPTLSGAVGQLGVSEEGEPLYRLAAERTTESLGEDTATGAALRLLLGAADNSLLRLEGWLADLLPGRDRWLRQLADPGSQSLSAAATDALQRLRQERIEELRRSVETQIENEVFTAVRELSPDLPDDPLIGWQRAASLLLTGTGTWRQRFTKNEGVPPGASPLRRRLKALIERLDAVGGLRDRLAALATLPDPDLAPGQTELLEALELLLPRLLAELKVLFQQNNQADYTELALAAEQALGACDRPSDLLLALDRRIEHILVDEFQDTSHLQWRLLELLTAGWSDGDGRTLFLVGDPMQSIYRFRDADLTLFLRACRHGIGLVSLKHLALTRNYRSAPALIDWANDTFASLFPSVDSPASGMPPFRAAVAARDVDQESGVHWHLFPEESHEREVGRITDLIRQELGHDPGQSIGILVRSRSHLAGLRAALRLAGFDAHAIEIDSLTDTQIGQDLISLTSALIHHGDRLAWLGVLRSPWCGLDWSDLMLLASGGKEETIPECMADPELVSRLSPEGGRRVGWLNNRLAEAFSVRASQPVDQWIRQCWLLIDGPATIRSQEEFDLAESFFIELGRSVRAGDVGDPATLRRRLSRPVAAAETAAEAGIEIMTMHRAKGLEFDTVILPGLARIIRGNAYKLLHIQDFPVPDNRSISLPAASADNRDPLMRLLRDAEKEQVAWERARLLYVATTRARSRLHLIGSFDASRSRPKSGSLLATLWPTLDDADSLVQDSAAPEAPEAELVNLPLRRLSFDVALPEAPPEAEPARVTPAAPEFEWVHPASVQVGTLIHQELQHLATRAAEQGNPVAPEIDIPRYRGALSLLGVEHQDLDKAAERVAEALRLVWSDDRGRWILKPWQEGWSEVRLSIRHANRLEHIQLDRSFVDEDGTRWIIDYKTGRHLGSDTEAFLDAEIERYAQQLERYRRAVAEIDARPLRVALYFPLMQEFREYQS